MIRIRRGQEQQQPQQQYTAAYEQSTHATPAAYVEQPVEQYDTQSQQPTPNVGSGLCVRDPYTFEPITDRSQTVDSEGNELPKGYNADDSATICLALAGARSSGKSMYIAVLINQLKKYATAAGHVFESVGETAENYYNEYYAKLYEENTVLSPTTRDVDNHPPLIYDLKYKSNLQRSATNVTSDDPASKRLFIVIRDVAGEDLQSPAHEFQEEQHKLSFLLHADTTIFLYDPLCVSRIREMLKIPDSQGGSDPENALQALRNIMTLYTDPERPAHLSLTLSKFDTLQKLGEKAVNGAFDEHTGSVDWPRVMRNYGLAVRREGSPYNEPYDRKDRDLLAAEVRSLLRLLSDGEFMNQLGQRDAYVNADYFAVSALGKVLSGATRLDETGIAPFRVLDPVRRVFDNYGVLEITDRKKGW